MGALVEWIVFLVFSAIAVVTAAGMLLTRSMYRAGLSLMTCVVALAGLFILLDADLLAAIQIMMNVGGVLVMILFMAMIVADPGGEMMVDLKRKMKMPAHTTTTQLPAALVVGAVSAVLLIVLFIRIDWPVTRANPTKDSTIAVGELLLSRYAIGFEVAALLILAGMVGAVIFARREGPPQ